MGALQLAGKGGFGSADPYCIIRIKNVEARTSVKRGDLNPVWQELLAFNNFKPKPNKELQAIVVVMNRNRLRKDNVIGMATFLLPKNFANLEKHAIELKSRKGNSRGVVVIHTYCQKYEFNTMIEQTFDFN